MHLRTTYKSDFLSTLLFFEVSWFIFGFYAIWGQLIIISIIRDLVDSDILIKIRNVAVILGLPFIMLAWIMMIKMAGEISGRKVNLKFIIAFLLINLLVVPGLCYLVTSFISISLFGLVKTAFIILNFLYPLIAAMFLISDLKNPNTLHYSDRKNLFLGLLLFTVLLNAALIFYNSNIYIALVFILLYFGLGIFFPVFLRYKTDLSKLLIPVEIKSFETFCEKHEISKREKEIIHEICNGLTNQQIADRLYISLQTVKDHTHRIYLKTDCTSRAQLIRLVNGSL